MCNPYVPIGTESEKHTKNRVRPKIKKDRGRDRGRERESERGKYYKKWLCTLKVETATHAPMQGQVTGSGRGLPRPRPGRVGLVTAIGLVGCSKAGERVVCFPLAAQITLRCWSLELQLPKVARVCLCRSDFVCLYLLSVVPANLKTSNELSNICLSRLSVCLAQCLCQKSFSRPLLGLLLL